MTGKDREIGRVLILHDLEPGQAQKHLPAPSEMVTLFPALPMVRHCLGCFGCWVRTPGRCVLGDRASAFSSLMPAHDRLSIVSRLVFGGLSAPVKAVLDRSIGFILPFFEDRGGEMRHRRRYPRSPDLAYLYYGQDLDEAQMVTARELARHNQRNFMAPNASVRFFDSLDRLGEALA
ncbi:MAG: hypothetical protein LBP92_07975 [Deltaproteobacteria bacterium]|nr:hypothetical protein [Deltaproteobacteria bacterium]